MSIVAELKKFFEGDVADDSATLTVYSRDASLFEVRPSLVVFPKHVEDIKNLTKFVSQEKAQGVDVSLTPRSAGTDMSGGPLSASVVVDVARHLKCIKKIGVDYAVVEPGVLYRDFEKETLKKDLLLPSYPASREMCAIGGMVANNSGGEKSLEYGKTERYVEELKAVLADGNEYTLGPLTLAELETKKRISSFEGEVYRKMWDVININYELLQKARPRVSKNSTGYALWDVFDKNRGIFDLSKVIVGSQGTLGIITEIKVKLIRPKPHSRLLVIFLPDMKTLAEIGDRVLRYKPESFESYDDHTFKVALRFFPAVAKQFKTGLLRLAIDFLPEFWMAITGGIPKLVLIAEFTGSTEAEAEEKAEMAHQGIKTLMLKAKVTKSKEEAEKYRTIRRESYNILRHHVRGLRTAPFIDDLVVRPERLSEFFPRLYQILDRYDLVYTIAGHVGDGNFHIIPLMDLSRKDARAIIKNLAGEVYKLVFEFKGSISGEHNDGLIRGPYLRAMYGDQVFRLFEETKKIFDPDDIFNPGKKTEAKLDEVLGRIAIE